MSVLQSLFDSLSGEPEDRIASELGVGRGDASKAIAAALPMLLGALQRNSGRADGAEGLLSALDRDHDGSVLDDLSGFLGRAGGDGDGILRHLLGDRRTAAESALGEVGGLDRGAAGRLLALLAPLVMGALGREKRSRGLDAGGLSDLLRGERRQAPGPSADAMDAVTRWLDADGDGDVADDLMGKLGGGLLSGLFPGR